MDEEPSAPGTAIIPIKEQTVVFYGDAIPVAQAPNGELYVPLRPLTDFLGLDAAAQRRRVARDDVLAAGVARISIATTDGKRYSMLCLPLDLLPGWLFGIQPARIRPELADKLRRYRAECFKVLWASFKGDVLPATPPPADLSPAEQALALAEAVASLARQHLELEERGTRMADYLRPFVHQTKTQLRDHEARLGAHEERLGALELQLSGGTTISEVQATEIQQTVRHVAGAMHHRGEAWTTAFPLIWGEFFRRYQVGVYRNLPAARYTEALEWLRQWYAELSGQPLPQQDTLFFEGE